MADYRVVRVLGRGAFGEVSLCVSLHDHQYYAIKRLRKAEMLVRQEVPRPLAHPPTASLPSLTRPPPALCAYHVSGVWVRS
jgi:serine/threonine protein kinase